MLSVDLADAQALATVAQQALLARFNADRDAEYTEVVERAQALVAELDREGERGKFTFAEVEENDADLAELRRWLDAIGRRDRHGAAGRMSAEQAVAHADRALRAFTEGSAQAERDHDDEAGEMQ